MLVGRLAKTFGLTIAVALLTVGSAWADLREVALVIGNSTYQTVPQLRNPGNDAALVADQLKSIGFEVVGGGPALDLTKRNMKKALTDFAIAARNADVALVYYAGHGVQVNGENYLIPIDADPVTEDDVPAESLSASAVLTALATLHSRLNFMILDACRDNPFATRSLYRSIGPPPAGLAEMPVTHATIIWYATEPGKKAKDGDGANGPYATAISHYIARRGLDADGFFNLSGQEVYKVTNKYQIPWLAASVQSARYYFLDLNGKGAFIPYDQSLDRSLNAASLFSYSSRNAVGLASSVFSSGVKVPGRAFVFGQPYQVINSLLDSSFQINSWETLPRAGEYNPDDVRYFWVHLSALPVVQSAIANLVGGPKCIDPQSYITFFFKEQKFFHGSIRFFRSPQCSSYDWIRAALFPSGKSEAILTGGQGQVSLVYHDIPYYSVLEITKKGVADEQASIIGSR